MTVIMVISLTTASSSFRVQGYLSAAVLVVAVEELLLEPAHGLPPLADQELAGLFRVELLVFVERARIQVEEQVDLDPTLQHRGRGTLPSVTLQRKTTLYDWICTEARVA